MVPISPANSELHTAPNPGIDRNILAILEFAASAAILASSRLTLSSSSRHRRKKVAQSQRYYEKKRAEGKKHNQAIRALGRHLTRIIYKLLKEEREYEIRPEQGNTKTRV